MKNICATNSHGIGAIAKRGRDENFHGVNCIGQADDLNSVISDLRG
jgi:hypothetical protein